MPDVGEVRYKAVVDNSGVDQQIDETEKKIKKIGDSADKTSDRVQKSAEKSGSTIKKTTNDTSQGFKKGSEEVNRFSDALGKVPNGTIGKLNSEIEDSKVALKGVNEALEKAPHSFGLLKEKLALTKDEIKSTGDKLKELKEIQEEAKKAFKSGEISSDDYRAIKRETLETQAGLKELKHEAKDAYKQLATSNHAVAGISKVGGALGKISIATIKGIGKAFIGLTSAAGAGMAAVAKMGIDYNAQMQSYETAFRTMLGDAEKATALTDKLKTLAAKTPLAMTDLADASKTLLAFGSSAEELPDQLKRLGDVAQGDAQALGTMATAFGRVQSNGYASLEEINMMIDQGFNPLQIIADKTGESMADVRKRVSEGKVSFEELNEALQTATDSGGQFYNAMENQSKTFEGQMSTLKDNVSALAGTLTEDLFASLAENALPKVNEWVNQLTEAAETEGTAGAIETAGVILTEMITELINGAPKFVETAISLVGSFLGAIDANGPKIMEGALQVIMTLINGFISMLPQMIETAGTLIESLLNGISNHMPEILTMAVRLVVALATGIIKALPQLIIAAAKLIESFVTSFTKMDWGQIGKDVVDGIIGGLTSAASRLLEAAGNLAKRALGSIKGAFDSHSPSKKAIAIAKTVPQGMVKAWDDDSLAAAAAKDLGDRAIAGLTADVNYHVPDVGKYAKSLTADFSGSYRAGAEIIVPLSVDGREIARASAWWTGEQLSWEEM